LELVAGGGFEPPTFGYEIDERSDAQGRTRYLSETLNT
jgi:hypothetical protein